MRSLLSIPCRGLVLVVVSAVIALDQGAWGAFAPPNEWERCLTFDPDTGEPRIDATCFFDALVDRYRNLTAYEDVANVLQVTERDGETPERVETRIGSKVADGHLQVETPASEARRKLGLDVQLRMSPAMQLLRLRYNLWMAPHMALKFAAQPQRDFRSGVREGFVSMEAAAVTIDDKPMVRLELTSPEGPEGDGARFDLFVNPESMLVERIQGEQRLPDGARYETRLDITPKLAVTGDPSASSLPSRPSRLSMREAPDDPAGTIGAVDDAEPPGLVESMPAEVEAKGTNEPIEAPPALDRPEPQVPQVPQEPPVT